MMEWERQPWDRQPKETTREYEARWMYIQMGSDRTQEQVSRRLGKSKAYISRLGMKWKWMESARAWDIYQDQLRVLAVQKALAEKLAADAEKWAKRGEELPDMMYAVTVDAFNDLSETARLARDPTTRLPVRDKGVQVRSFCRAAPLAERALEMVARRNQVTNAAGTATPVPAGITGGAKEALRAYQEYQDSLARANRDLDRAGSDDGESEES